MSKQELKSRVDKYPKPPKQSQLWPGLASKMDQRPDHGETSSVVVNGKRFEKIFAERLSLNDPLSIRKRVHLMDDVDLGSVQDDGSARILLQSGR